MIHPQPMQRNVHVACGGKGGNRGREQTAFAKEIGVEKKAPTYRTEERQSANIYMTADCEMQAVYSAYQITRCHKQEHNSAKYSLFHN
jgi:hypothetical protein